MVLDLVAVFLISVFDLLKTGLLLSIPVFVLALIAAAIQSKLSKKLDMNWVKTSFISTYVIVTLLIFFLYFFPLLSVPFDLKGTVPPEFLPSAQDVIFYNISTFVSLLLKSLVLTIIVIPFELIASLAFSFLDKKFAGKTMLKVFASVYLTVLLVIALVLFIMPWLLLALVMFIYGGS